MNFFLTLCTICIKERKSPLKILFFSKCVLCMVLQNHKNIVVAK